MKTVIIAFLVALVISHGESLRCKCGGTARDCPDVIETCQPSHVFCGNIVLAGVPGLYFQGCMEPVECRGLNNPFIKATCCTRDLCNAYYDSFLSETTPGSVLVTQGGSVQFPKPKSVFRRKTSLTRSITFSGVDSPNVVDFSSRCWIDLVTSPLPF
ncbi:three-finger toxin MALT0070C-like [Xyrichtys novacula]|uniref:Three-finger toxin MALT0070C-like n=1 Tax=Xyrichtys novacula TaxID=13765 RepID=A0AAV1H4Q1_XYRNO|nr:three-finger toxin MALT0070C-like [Xyrichtys novacula]